MLLHLPLAISSLDSAIGGDIWDAGPVPSSQSVLPWNEICILLPKAWLPCTFFVCSGLLKPIKYNHEANYHGQCFGVY